MDKNDDPHLQDMLVQNENLSSDERPQLVSELNELDLDYVDTFDATKSEAF
ncbi:unnamed protein product, partial [Didymodactylos carnosus]